jgi:hypothetical protein
MNMIRRNQKFNRKSIKIFLFEYNSILYYSRINDSEPIYKALALHHFYGQTNRFD